MFYVLLNYEYVDFTFSYFSFCLCGYIEQIQQSFLFLQHPNLTIFIFISAGRKICFVIKTPCSGESEVGEAVDWAEVWTLLSHRREEWGAGYYPVTVTTTRTTTTTDRMN